MKPFKLDDKSWRKAKVTARLDERSYTVETDKGAVYRRNRQHLRKTSEPAVEPTSTVPEPDMASADEQATTTAASTPDQSNAPREPHPEEVTVPEQCRSSERVRRSPAYLKDYIRDQTRDFKSVVAVIMGFSVLVYRSSHVEITN